MRHESQEIKLKHFNSEENIRLTRAAEKMLLLTKLVKLLNWSTFGVFSCETVVLKWRHVVQFSVVLLINGWISWIWG